MLGMGGERLGNAGLRKSAADGRGLRSGVKESEEEKETRVWVRGEEGEGARLEARRV